jgi:PAS domain S-box-containing protein
VDLIPVINNQEYLLFDNNFTIVQFSSNIAKYATQTIVVNDDIRRGFPELVGLESVCQEILLGQEESFVLESISRSQNAHETIYFNLYLKSVSEHLIILLEDVTELVSLRQLSMQQLNEAELAINRLERFEYCTNKIIASMKDILLIATPSGMIERVNKSTTDLFGEPKAQLLDQPINELILDPTFNHQEIYNYLLASKNTEKKIEVNFADQQKQEINIEFNCFLAPTEIKNFFNCVYIGRDITARKKAEIEIYKSLAREKELRKLKSGFISMASHEFRNPLSSILLCVQNLEADNQLNKSEKIFYLKSIQDAALNMNSLLEDVLIMSKAESGKQNLKLVNLDLEDFCLQIIQELTAIYADRQINFEYLVNINPVNLDRTTLRHILNNLLSNALKYSPQTTTVDLKVSHNSNNFNNSPEIIIEISDRGIGIPEESQKHLFESFYRAGNVGNTPGTGLGLSIVHQAVKLYQGLITVDSKLSQGTKITVRLPL